MIAIIKSKFNKQITNGLLFGCKQALIESKYNEDLIHQSKLLKYFDGEYNILEIKVVTMITKNNNGKILLALLS